MELVSVKDISLRRDVISSQRILVLQVWVWVSCEAVHSRTSMSESAVCPADGRLARGRGCSKGRVPVSLVIFICLQNCSLESNKNPGLCSRENFFLCDKKMLV